MKFVRLLGLLCFVSFSLFFALGLALHFLMGVGAASQTEADEWQAAQIAESVDIDVLLSAVLAEGLLGQTADVSEEKISKPNELNGQITLPGQSGTLLGMFFQGDEQMALIRQFDTNIVHEYRPGETIAPGIVLKELRENAIDLVLDGKVVNFRLYPEQAASTHGSNSVD